MGALRSGVGAVLRGVSQVMLQSNLLTGLTFLLALLVGDPWVGLAGAVAAVIATLAARWPLRVDAEELAQGLYGFNGVLVGVALVSMAGPGWRSWLYVVVGAVLSSVVMSAVSRGGTGGLPALTAPFCATAGLLLILIPLVDKAESGTDPTYGMLDGLSQVFLQANPWSGVLILAGLAVASGRAAVAAVVGSVIGMIVGRLCGGSPAEVSLGLYGYNAVLTAIALSATARSSTGGGAGWVLAALGCATSVVVTAAARPLFAELGLPLLTWPFVVTTWLFLAADPRAERTAVPRT